jgi:hypothetical protein
MFNAKELDEENGMYYYEARYYIPLNTPFNGPSIYGYPGEKYLQQGKIKK